MSPIYNTIEKIKVIKKKNETSETKETLLK